MKIRNINQKDSKDLFEWRNNYEVEKCLSNKENNSRRT